MDCILYRAVTQTEYDDIVNQGNRFRSIISSLEDKQFAIDEDCGHYYGREIVMRCDKVDYILIKVTVSISSYCDDVINLDNCKGVSVDRDLIEEFNDSIISFERVN